MELLKTSHERFVETPRESLRGTRAGMGMGGVGSFGQASLFVRCGWDGTRHIHVSGTSSERDMNATGGAIPSGNVWRRATAGQDTSCDFCPM